MVVDWVAQAKTFEPAIVLRTQTKLDLALIARAFPSTSPEQRDLVAHLQNHDDLIATLNEAQDCAVLLDGRWRGADTDWASVRLMTQWVTTATTFEPAINLRQTGVLKNAGEAGKLSRELRDAIVEASLAFDALLSALDLTVDKSVVGGVFDDCSHPPLIARRPAAESKTRLLVPCDMPLG